MHFMQLLSTMHVCSFCSWNAKKLWFLPGTLKDLSEEVEVVKEEEEFVQFDYKLVVNPIL